MSSLHGARLRSRVLTIAATFIAASMPAVATPLGFYNQRIAAAWSRLAPEAEARLERLIEHQLAELDARDDFNVRGHDLDLEIAPPPGFVRLDDARVHLRSPLAPEASWRMHLRVEGEGDFLGVWEPNVNVEIDVIGLVVTASVDLDVSDPLHPVVTAADSDVTFHVEVDVSGNWVVDNVLGEVFCSDDLEDTARRFGDEMSEMLQEDLRFTLLGLETQLVGGPDISYGRGGPVPPAIDPSFDLAQLEAAAIQYENRIAEYHQPYQTLLDVTHTINGSQWEMENDSAIFTGHLLAAQSFEWYATRGQHHLLQLAMLRQTLNGVDRLFDMTGAAGHLARCAIPCRQEPVPEWFPDPPDSANMCDSPDGRRYYNRTVEDKEAYHLRRVGDSWWIGGGEISRDQYMGVLMGLTWAYVLVPEVRAQAGPHITNIANFLLGHDWVAEECLKCSSSDPSLPGNPIVHHYISPPDTVKTSTEFVFHPEQMLAVLFAARLVDPVTFGPVVQQYRQLAEFAWFPAWAETFNSVTNQGSSYYKFNLDHASMPLAIYWEDDPIRRQQLLRAHRITRNAISHHQNPYFNAVHLLIERSALAPAEQASIVAESLEELRQFTLRPNRRVTPQGAELYFVAPPFEHAGFVALQPKFASNVEAPCGFGGNGQDDDDEDGTPGYDPCVTSSCWRPYCPARSWDEGRDVQAKYPIPVQHRIGWHYMWEKSPFHAPMGKCWARLPEVEQRLAWLGECEACPTGPSNACPCASGDWECVRDCMMEVDELEFEQVWLPRHLADPCSVRADIDAMTNNCEREITGVDYLIAYWLLRAVMPPPGGGSSTFPDPEQGPSPCIVCP